MKYAFHCFLIMSIIGTIAAILCYDGTKVWEYLVYSFFALDLIFLSTIQHFTKGDDNEIPNI